MSDPKKKFMQEIELETKFLHALEDAHENLLYYYCPTAYSYDAFIKVIQPVPKNASGAFSINMQVLECDS